MVPFVTWQRRHQCHSLLRYTPTLVSRTHLPKSTAFRKRWRELCGDTRHQATPAVHPKSAKYGHIRWRLSVKHAFRRKFSRNSQITNPIHFYEHSCTEFNPNGPHIKNTRRISFTPLQKSTAVNKPILTELVNAEWYHGELPCIEFCQNLSRNMKSTGTNFFMPSSEQASLGLYSKTSEPNLIKILQTI
jgi:hypothetical protein